MKIRSKNILSADGAWRIFRIVMATLFIADCLYLYPDLPFYFGEFPVTPLLVKSIWSFFVLSSTLLFFDSVYVFGLALLIPALGLVQFVSFTNVYGFYYYLQLAFVLLFLEFLSKDKRLVWSFGKLIFSLTYLNASLAKLGSPAWRDGTVLFTIAGGIFRHQLPNFLLPLCLVMSWMVLVIQFFYLPSLFTNKLRLPFLVLTLLIHLGIMLGMGLWLFGLILIVFNLFFFCRSESTPYQILIRSAPVLNLRKRISLVVTPTQR